MESGSAVMMTWSKAGVIAEALGSIGIVFTLLYSVWSFKTTLRDAYYAEIDRVYFELLKIGLERPELLTCQFTRALDDYRQRSDFIQVRPNKLCKAVKKILGLLVESTCGLDAAWRRRFRRRSSRRSRTCCSRRRPSGSAAR